MSEHLVALPVVSALKVFELPIVPRSAVLMATMLAMAGFGSGGLVPDDLADQPEVSWTFAAELRRRRPAQSACKAMGGAASIPLQPLARNRPPLETRNDGRPSFRIWSLHAETASDLQGSPTGAIGDDIMSCCGPKTSAPANKARDILKATETPKAEGSTCCGGGAHRADATTPSAGKDAPAPAGAAHQH